MTALKDADSALDDVFASGRDRGADSAAPEPEAAPPPKAEAPPIDDKAKAEPPAKDDAEEGSSKQFRDPETGRFVPLTELKTERAKRQEFEKRATELEQRALRAEAAAEEARRYWQTQQQQIPQPQQQQPPKQIPDPWTDPEGYTAAKLQEVEQKFARQEFQSRVVLSERLMRQQHQDFDQVVEVFGQAANRNPYLLQQMTQSPLPAEYAYQMGKRLQLADRIGSDPDSYEKKIREEERQKVLAELKAPPAQQQRFPGTLADAPAAGAQGRMLTDDAMLNDVFSSDRRARKR